MARAKKSVLPSGIALREQLFQFIGGDRDLDRHTAWTSMPMARSADAEIFPLWMSPDRRDVIAIEQRVQQISCHRHDLGLVVRPDEVARLQSLYHQPEAATIPEENFDAVMTPIPEDVKRGVHRVQLH